MAAVQMEKDGGDESTGLPPLGSNTGVGLGAGADEVRRVPVRPPCVLPRGHRLNPKRLLDTRSYHLARGAFIASIVDAIRLCTFDGDASALFNEPQLHKIMVHLKHKTTALEAMLEALATLLCRLLFSLASLWLPGFLFQYLLASCTSWLYA